MDEMGATRRWTARQEEVAQPQRARKAVRFGFASLPSLTVALFHRLPRALSFSSASAEPGERHRDESGNRSAVANGAAFAGYTILRPLGAGGMSEVYLAKHPRLPRRDVLKVLAEEITADIEFRERFNREADLAATLWHPHIIGVHDRGEFDGQLWISMDYVEGTDAARLVKEDYPHGMPIDQVREIVSAVAGALDYAHDRGLLHRDVKPANILLTHLDGGERRILLADFGIARHLGDISGITATNVAVGTVAYAAPEQLVGLKIDGRADEYALAATAFHLLTGSPPYQNSNPVAVIGQHLNADLPKISDYRPDLPYLDDIFFKALAKQPEARFDRCRAFAVALNETTADSSGSALGGHSDRFVLRRLSLRVRVASALVIAMLVAVAGTWSTLHFVHTRRLQHKPPSSAAGPTPGAVTAVLNGTYRLDYDRAKRTSNGVPIRHDSASTGPASTGVQSSWWAFRSACTATSCAATATKLDDGTHLTASTTGGGRTDVLHFIDGYWQGAPEQEQVACHPPDGGNSAQTEMDAWSLAPQADGTLRGMFTETVRTNECGAQGAVIRVPVVATRVGDVPPKVTVPDPVAAANVPTAPATTSPPVLGGICADPDKLAYDPTTHEQVVCEGNTWDKAPITTGVHASGSSCDRPDIPVFATSATNDGYLIECDPTTRIWSRTHG